MFLSMFFRSKKEKTLSTGTQAAGIVDACNATALAYTNLRSSLQARIPIAKRKDSAEQREMIRQLALVDDLVRAVQREEQLRAVWR